MKKMYSKPLVEVCETANLMDTVGVSVNNTEYNGGGNAPARKSYSPQVPH